MYSKIDKVFFFKKKNRKSIFYYISIREQSSKRWMFFYYEILYFYSYLNYTPNQIPDSSKQYQTYVRVKII